MCTRQGCWLAWLPNLQGTMLCVGVRACVLACVRACVKDQPCSVLIPSAACCLVLATSNGEHNVVATVPDPHPATHAHNSPPTSHVHSQLVRKGATGVSIVLPSGTHPQQQGATALLQKKRTARMHTQVNTACRYRTHLQSPRSDPHLESSVGLVCPPCF